MQHLFLHQRLPRAAGAAGGNVVFTDGVPRQGILRNVNPPFEPVYGNVLPEIGQLQAGSDGVGVADIFLVDGAV
jgi:hypothetical protein